MKTSRKEKKRLKKLAKRLGGQVRYSRKKPVVMLNSRGKYMSTTAITAVRFHEPISNERMHTPCFKLQ